MQTKTKLNFNLAFSFSSVYQYEDRIKKYISKKQIRPIKEQSVLIGLLPSYFSDSIGIDMSPKKKSLRVINSVNNQKNNKILPFLYEIPIEQKNITLDSTLIRRDQSNYYVKDTKPLPRSISFKARLFISDKGLCCVFPKHIIKKLCCAENITNNLELITDPHVVVVPLRRLPKFTSIEEIGKMVYFHVISLETNKSTDALGEGYSSVNLYSHSIDKIRKKYNYYNQTLSCLIGIRKNSISLGHTYQINPSYYFI